MTKIIGTKKKKIIGTVNIVVDCVYIKYTHILTCSKRILKMIMSAECDDVCP